MDDKVAVVTGGTSGMALASAKLFVEEGAYVFITGRKQESLNDAVKRIGRNVTGIQADSSKLSDLDTLYETVQQEKGHVDVVFASAGHSSRAPLGEITEEQFDSLFSLNSRGTLFTVQKTLPLMREGGSIIMNGSIAHLKGMPEMSVYAGSKAAIRSFARSWAVELAERRIRVNVLSPGPIATNAHAKLSAQAKEYFRSKIPPKEMGNPEEIATAALFLASNDSAFVNGSELCVDGGMAQI